MGPWDVSAFKRSFLLLLLAFLVFFIFVRRVLAVIISQVNFIREFDSEGALLDPWRFGFKRNCLRRELIEDRIVYARDHVGWLDERETE